MDIFSDHKTKLVFPMKMGRWIRQSITNHPSPTAGFSVVYQLQSWLGRCKTSVSVDVYDKGLEGIPPGADSFFVAVELQNCMRAMFDDVPPVEPSIIEAYLRGEDVGAAQVIGEVNLMDEFRSALREATIAGTSCHFSVHLVGHRGHFVKVQVFDFTKSASFAEISMFLSQLLTQMHIGDDGQIHQGCHPNG